MMKRIVLSVCAAVAAVTIDASAVDSSVSVTSSADGMVVVTVAPNMVESACPLFLAWDTADKGEALADWANQTALGDVTAAGGSFEANGVDLAIPANATIRAIVTERGYELLDYIGSSGTQYIDTGIVGDFGDIYEVKFAVTSQKDSTSALHILSEYDTSKGADYGRYQAVMRSSSGRIGQGFESSSQTGPDPTFYVGSTSLNVFYTVVSDFTKGNRKLTVYDADKTAPLATDGTTTSVHGTIYNPNAYPLYLFAANNAGTAAAMDRGNMRISYMKLTRGGAVAKHLVAAKQSQMVGMVDVANGNSFHPNKGTGSFSAGSVIGMLHGATLGASSAIGYDGPEPPTPEAEWAGLFPSNVCHICVVAPCSQHPEAIYSAAKSKLEEAGYTVTLSPEVTNGAGTSEMTPAQKADYFMRAWTNEEYDVIWAIRGGNGGEQTFAKLNPDVIRSRDVPFIGFSNVSSILNPMEKLGVRQLISGPSLGALYTYNTPKASRDIICQLVGGEPVATNVQLSVQRAAAATVTGKPIGGHWTSLSLNDAADLPDCTGRIVFLEINPQSYENAVSSFDTLRGKWNMNDAAAVVIGEILTTTKQAEMLQYIVDHVTCPVYSDYPMGHQSDVEFFSVDFGRYMTITPSGMITYEDANYVPKRVAGISVANNISVTAGALSPAAGFYQPEEGAVFTATDGASKTIGSFCCGWVHEIMNESGEVISSSDSAEKTFVYSAADGAFQRLVWQWSNEFAVVAGNYSGGTMTVNGEELEPGESVWWASGSLESITLVAAPDVGNVFDGWGWEIPAELRGSPTITLPADCGWSVVPSFSPEHDKRYYLEKDLTDAAKTSSLDGTGGVWTDADGKGGHQLPVAGNDYVAEDFALLRTPELENGSSFVFQGDSLVLSATDDAVRWFVLKTCTPNVEVGAACVISNLTIRNVSVAPQSVGSLGLAGNLTIPEGCFANLGRGCTSDFRLSLQSNLKGVGVARFPLRGGTVTYLSGDNSAFLGDVTVGIGGGGSEAYDGTGTLCFYSPTSWFGNAGALTVESSSTILEFRESMSISTPDRTVDFGTFKPTIKVASGKVVVLNARVIGSCGFVKDGGGTLILGDAATVSGADIEVRNGVVIEANDPVKATVGSCSLVLVYANADERFAGGSAWLAIGKGTDVPDSLPGESFSLLRTNLSFPGTYQTACIVEENEDYWTIVRYRTVQGETRDFPLHFKTLGADNVFYRNDAADVLGESCFLLPSRWNDSNGGALGQFVRPGDYCIAQNVLCRAPSSASDFRFDGRTVVLGNDDPSVSCGIFNKSCGFGATILVRGSGFCTASEEKGHVSALNGLVWIRKGAAFKFTTNTDSGYTSVVGSDLAGPGKLIVVSRTDKELTHAVRFTGDNGGLVGPVELTMGLKELSVEFAAANSWFGDMEVPTADGLKISDGVLVKFSKSFVGETPNRGIDLGTGTPTFEVAEGVVAEITSPVRGGGGFVKTGKGTLALMSSQLKGITGTIRVDAGVLELPTRRSLSKKVVLDIADGAEVRYRSRSQGLAVIIF